MLTPPVSAHLLTGFQDWKRGCIYILLIQNASCSREIVSVLIGVLQNFKLSDVETRGGG